MTQGALRLFRLQDPRGGRRKRVHLSHRVHEGCVERELAGDENRIERRVAAALDQIRSDQHRQYEVTNTLFDFCDALAKAVLPAGANFRLHFPAQENATSVS